MKILILSLLRIGDLLMMAPTIQALRRRYPNARIDILVNNTTVKVKDLFPEINNFYCFDRDGLQHGLSEAECALLEPYDYLSELVDKLNANQYDIIFNLTQNRLSGYLSALIKANDKLGLSMSSNGQATFSSAWFRYLNDHVAGGTESTFHYNDIFCFGAGLSEMPNKFTFQETSKGKSELQLLLANTGYPAGYKIVIQALTSDSKKNMPLDKWQDVIKQISLLEKSAFFYILAAPDEKARLAELCKKLNEDGIHNALAVLSFEGALSLLQVCDLLVTGDTSIKHLAAGTDIQIMEICIGSADYRKTGTYKDQSLILQSKESCVPCSHRTACYQQSHLCADNMPAELIALSAIKLVQRDWSAIKILATEYNDTTRLLRTFKFTNTFWEAQELSDTVTTQHISKYLDRAAWQFYLEREHLQPLAKYGTLGLKVKESLDKINPIVDIVKVKMILDSIELTVLSSETRLNSILSNISKRVRVNDDMTGFDFIDPVVKTDIQKVEKDLGLGNVLTEKLHNQSGFGIQALRGIQSVLNETFNHQQIKLKLIRAIKAQYMERT